MDLLVYTILEKGLYYLPIYLIVGLSAGLVINRILWLVGGRQGGLIGDIIDSMIWSNIMGFLVFIVLAELSYRSDNISLMAYIPTIGAFAAFMGTIFVVGQRTRYNYRYR